MQPWTAAVRRRRRPPPHPVTLQRAARSWSVACCPVPTLLPRSRLPTTQQVSYARLPEVQWTQPYKDLTITVQDTGVTDA
jgi:hypothetical protein